MTDQSAVIQVTKEAMISQQEILENITSERPFLIAPETMRVISVEEHLPAPSRVRKKIKFTDTKGFVDYFSLFKDSYKPRLFTMGTSAGMQTLCVFDYDEPGSATSPGALPQWNQHLSTLALAYHPDYATLKSKDNEFMKQEEFALFVEENLHLFTNPDSATMLELAQELKGKRNVGFQSGRRLANGETKLEFIETIEAKSTRGDVTVPEYLLMKTPIFDGYSEQEIKAAFRWRLDDGGRVFFAYRLLTKVAERKAVEEVKAEVSKAVNLPLYAVSTFEGIISHRE